MIVETAGIFILNNNLELLLAHPTHHPDTFWSITKGKIEEGERVIDAAIRETMEECNVDFNVVRVLKYTALQPVTFKNKKKRLNALLILASENVQINFDTFDLKCNTFVEKEKGGFPEMDGFKWVTIDVAKTLVHESQVKCLLEIETIISNRW